ncbi:MAG TPA: hypothetical protein VLH84_00430 [Patescibacteria group bacterium]|nr:hypothetical protein [Patescibacteria group bacterium]
MDSDIIVPTRVARPIDRRTAPLPPKKLYFSAPPRAQRTRWSRLQLPAIVLAGLVGGALVQDATIGALLAAAYGLVALIWRLPSRITFALAALSLVAVCAMLLLKPDGQLMGNFATYTFIFLIIGVVSLARESRLPRSPYQRKKR